MYGTITSSTSLPPLRPWPGTKCSGSRATRRSRTQPSLRNARPRSWVDGVPAEVSRHERPILGKPQEGVAVGVPAAEGGDLDRALVLDHQAAIDENVWRRVGVGPRPGLAGTAERSALEKKNREALRRHRRREGPAHGPPDSGGPGWSRYRTREGLVEQPPQWPLSARPPPGSCKDCQSRGDHLLSPWRHDATSARYAGDRRRQGADGRQSYEEDPTRVIGPVGLCHLPSAICPLFTLRKSRFRGMVPVVTQHSISKLTGGRPRKTYGGDRVCSHDGCDTRISSYNKNDLCWTHFQPVPRPARIPQPTKS
jgi:hypothetical protein